MTAPELSSTSSVGACWPPQSGTHNRIRGFFDQTVVTGPAEVEAFAEAYRQADNDLEASGASRLSIRAVALPETLPMLEEAGVQVEAAMPLSIPIQGQSRGDHIIAYTGHNLDTRRGLIDPELELDSSPVGPQLLWRNVLRERQEAMRRRLQNQLHIGEISSTSTDEQRLSLVDEFCDLYLPFGYNESDVRELLENPDNHIVYVQNAEGQIVSTAMAEIARLSIGGLGTLVMAEVTEASTRPEFRGQGLYRLASGALICRLADVSHEAITQGEPPIHIVYGECNMNMPGVLHAALQNGRRFAASDVIHYGSMFGATQRADQGRLPFGILEQNFRVEDGVVAPGRYNDFALSYVPSVTMGSLLMYPGDQRDQLIHA